MASGDEIVESLAPPSVGDDDASAAQPTDSFTAFRLLPIELKDMVFRYVLIDLGLWNVNIYHHPRPFSRREPRLKLYGRTLLTSPINGWWRGQSYYTKLMRSTVRNQCFFKRYEAPGMPTQLRRFTELCLVNRDMYHGLTRAFLGGAWLDIELPCLWNKREGFMTDRIPNLSRQMVDNVSFGSRLRRVCLRFDHDNFNIQARRQAPFQENPPPTERKSPVPDWSWEGLGETLGGIFAALPILQYFELYCNSDEIFQILKEKGFLDRLTLHLAERKHRLREVFIRGGKCEDLVHELHALLSSSQTRVRVRGLEWTVNPCWEGCKEGINPYLEKIVKFSRVWDIVGGIKVDRSKRI